MFKQMSIFFPFFPHKIHIQGPTLDAPWVSLISLLFELEFFQSSLHMGDFFAQF